MSDRIHIDPSPFMGAPRDPEMTVCPECEGEGQVPVECECCGGCGWMHCYEPGELLWCGCPECGGDGAEIPGTGIDYATCRRCQGSGEIPYDPDDYS